MPAIARRHIQLDDDPPDQVRCNTDNQRSLHAPSAGLAIPAAISFASFAQLVLV